MAQFNSDKDPVGTPEKDVLWNRPVQGDAGFGKTSSSTSAPTTSSTSVPPPQKTWTTGNTPTTAPPVTALAPPPASPPTRGINSSTSSMVNQAELGITAGKNNQTGGLNTPAIVPKTSSGASADFSEDGFWKSAGKTALSGGQMGGAAIYDAMQGGYKAGRDYVGNPITRTVTGYEFPSPDWNSETKVEAGRFGENLSNTRKAWRSGVAPAMEAMGATKVSKPTAAATMVGTKEVQFPEGKPANFAGTSPVDLTPGWGTADSGKQTEITDPAQAQRMRDAGAPSGGGLVTNKSGKTWAFTDSGNNAWDDTNAGGRGPATFNGVPVNDYFTNKFNGGIDKAQKPAFDAWKAKMTEALNRDVSKDVVNYDIESAFKSGLTPEQVVAGNNHMPDKFKKPNHATFSDQSIYHGGDFQGGSWEGETFKPGIFNQMLHTDKYGAPEDSEVSIAPGKGGRTVEDIAAKTGMRVFGGNRTASGGNGTASANPTWTNKGKNEFGQTIIGNPGGGWSGPPKTSADILREELDANSSAMQSITDEIEQGRTGHRPGDVYKGGGEMLDSLTARYNNLISNKSRISTLLANDDTKQAETGLRNEQAGYYKAMAKSGKFEAAAERDIEQGDYYKRGLGAGITMPRNGSINPETTSNNYDKFTETMRKRDMEGTDMDAQTRWNVDPDTEALRRAGENGNYFVKDRTVYDRRTKLPIRKYGPPKAVPTE